MKARQQIQTPKPRRPFRGLMISIVVFGFLTLGGMGAVSLWFAHRLHQFDKLRTEVGRDYDRLRREHPFSAPDPAPAGQALPGERMSAYLRVRAELAASVRPRVNARAREILNRGRVGESHLIWVLQQSFDDFERSAKAHVAALERESMSPAEYRWLHGLVMRDALEAPGAPVGDVYRDTLAQVERLAMASGDDRVRGVTAEAYLNGLRERYAGYPPAGPAFWDGFQLAGPALALLDLAAAYYEATDAPRERSVSEIRPIE